MNNDAVTLQELTMFNMLTFEKTIEPEYSKSMKERLLKYQYVVLDGGEHISLDDAFRTSFEIMYEIAIKNIWDNKEDETTENQVSDTSLKSIEILKQYIDSVRNLKASSNDDLLRDVARMDARNTRILETLKKMEKDLSAIRRDISHIK